ncbi:MAG TPA: type 4a pilus biogenesis protein PilO [Planctomycetota bacterium]|jgi:Tfp pilus assembly protein PilO
MAASEWSERTRMIVTAAIALVVNLALGGYFYYVYGEWKKLDEEHKKKQKKITELSQYLKEHETTALDLKALEDKFRVQSAKLPPAAEVARFSVDITAKAQACKCANGGFTAKPASAGAGQSYTRSTWGTRWKGDFMGFCQFTNEMEEFYERFIAFENLSMTPANSGVVLSGAQHEYLVDIVTYQYAGNTAPAQP